MRGPTGPAPAFVAETQHCGRCIEVCSSFNLRQCLSFRSAGRRPIPLGTPVLHARPTTFTAMVRLPSPPHPSSRSPIGTLLLMAPALSPLLRPLHQWVWCCPRTAPALRFCTRNINGPHATLRLAASFGLSSVSAVICVRTISTLYSDRKALESINKVGNDNARVQRWLEYLTAFDHTLDYRTGASNDNAGWFLRLSQPANYHERTVPTSLNSLNEAASSSSIHALARPMLFQSLASVWVDENVGFGWATSDGQRRSGFSAARAANET